MILAEGSPRVNFICALLELESLLVSNEAYISRLHSSNSDTLANSLNGGVGFYGGSGLSENTIEKLSNAVASVFCCPVPGSIKSRCIGVLAHMMEACNSNKDRWPEADGEAEGERVWNALSRAAFGVVSNDTFQAVESVDVGADFEIALECELELGWGVTRALAEAVIAAAPLPAFRQGTGGYTALDVLLRRVLCAPAWTDDGRENPLWLLETDKVLDAWGAVGSSLAAVSASLHYWDPALVEKPEQAVRLSSPAARILVSLRRNVSSSSNVMSCAIRCILAAAAEAKLSMESQGESKVVGHVVCSCALSALSVLGDVLALNDRPGPWRGCIDVRRALLEELDFSAGNSVSSSNGALLWRRLPRALRCGAVALMFLGGWEARSSFWVDGRMGGWGQGGDVAVAALSLLSRCCQDSVFDANLAATLRASGGEVAVNSISSLFASCVHARRVSPCFFPSLPGTRLPWHTCSSIVNSSDVVDTENLELDVHVLQMLEMSLAHRAARGNSSAGVLLGVRGQSGTAQAQHVGDSGRSLLLTVYNVCIEWARDVSSLGDALNSNEYDRVTDYRTEVFQLCSVCVSRSLRICDRGVMMYGVQSLTDAGLRLPTMCSAAALLVRLLFEYGVANRGSDELRCVVECLGASARLCAVLLDRDPHPAKAAQEYFLSEDGWLLKALEVLGEVPEDERSLSLLSHVVSSAKLSIDARALRRCCVSGWHGDVDRSVVDVTLLLKEVEDSAARDLSVAFGGSTDNTWAALVEDRGRLLQPVLERNRHVYFSHIRGSAMQGCCALAVVALEAVANGGGDGGGQGAEGTLCIAEVLLQGALEGCRVGGLTARECGAALSQCILAASRVANVSAQKVNPVSFGSLGMKRCDRLRELARAACDVYAEGASAGGMRVTTAMWGAVILYARSILGIYAEGPPFEQVAAALLQNGKGLLSPAAFEAARVSGSGELPLMALNLIAFCLRLSGRVPTGPYTVESMIQQHGLVVSLSADWSEGSRLSVAMSGADGDLPAIVRTCVARLDVLQHIAEDPGGRRALLAHRVIDAFAHFLPLSQNCVELLRPVAVSSGANSGWVDSSLRRVCFHALLLPLLRLVVAVVQSGGEGAVQSCWRFVQRHQPLLRAVMSMGCSWRPEDWSLSFGGAESLLNERLELVVLHELSSALNLCEVALLHPPPNADTSALVDMVRDYTPKLFGRFSQLQVPVELWVMEDPASTLSRAQLSIANGSLSCVRLLCQGVAGSQPVLCFDAAATTSVVQFWQQRCTEKGFAAQAARRSEDGSDSWRNATVVESVLQRSCELSLHVAFLYIKASERFGRSSAKALLQRITSDYYRRVAALGNSDRAKLQHLLIQRLEKLEVDFPAS